MPQGPKAYLIAGLVPELESSAYRPEEFFCSL